MRPRESRPGSCHPPGHSGARSKPLVFHSGVCPLPSAQLEAWRLGMLHIQERSPLLSALFLVEPLLSLPGAASLRQG